MTAAILPEFILQLLEKEISNVSLEIVKYICKEYNLAYDEVVKKIGNYMCMELGVDKQNTYKITKVNVRRKQICTEERCAANMFHKDHKCVTQCTLQCVGGSQFCKKHTQMEKEGRLRFGTVTQPSHFK